jgi:hypothetical protein
MDLNKGQVNRTTPEIYPGVQRWVVSGGDQHLEADQGRG